MPIVGTAGHVDHGKSTLVEALTGRDPDRLAEEKRRGLTIDLGFAWMDVGGTELGFVDVPGHERFIKNMLAGVVGVDCALLVVAADSGWMPQTEEHAKILSLLGVPTGVIAVTRTDLVDDDTIELTTLEIAEEVADTPMASWPVVPVSAVTGDGLGDLQQVLVATALLATADVAAPFRMWVDRAFVIHGSGLVVTGTVQAGTLRTGDEIEVHPGSATARVRGLHHHDHAVDIVTAGQRAAINLSGIDLADARRGSRLSVPGTTADTTGLLVDVTTARGFDRLPNRGSFHVHLGTIDRPATIRTVRDSIVAITTDAPIPAVVKDRLILRESGRQAVVAGGTVIETRAAGRIGADAIERLAAAVTAAPDSDALADAILEARGHEAISVLKRATGGGAPSRAVMAGSTAVSLLRARHAVERAVGLTETYHAEHPRRAGIPIAELASRVGIAHDLMSSLVTGTEELDIADGTVRRPSFEGGLSDADEAAWAAARAALESSLDVPRASHLGLDTEVLHALIRRGDLERIEPDLVFTRAQIDQILGRLEGLDDPFTVAEFKEYFGMARRQSVPLLEWLDKQGITRRSGDTRTLVR